MAERKDLKVQSRTWPQHAVEGRQNGNQHGHHREPSLLGTVGKFNGFNTYDIFSMHMPIRAQDRNHAQLISHHDGLRWMQSARRL